MSVSYEGPAKKGSIKPTVLAIVCQNPEGIRKGDICRVYPGYVHPNNVELRLAELVDEGQIRREGTKGRKGFKYYPKID